MGEMGETSGYLNVEKWQNHKWSYWSQNRWPQY